MINCSHHCFGCLAQAWGEKRLEPDGDGTNGILIVGDSPWLEEMSQERNFSGASGSLLERCLRRVGVERSACTIANSVWCRAPRLGFYDKPSALSEQVTSQCRPHLDELIEQRRPRVIVTLGGVALRRVCGVTGITARHGYVHASPYGVPVIPSFHPSYILQGNAGMTTALVFDLNRAREIAKGGWTQTPASYVLDDYLGAADYFHKWPELLVVDIETPKSAKLDEEEAEEDESYTILRASMSHTPGTSVSFPWTEPYVSLAREACARAKVVVMHNANFDQPRLEAQGFTFKCVHDSMWEWHFLQSDLPKTLGFVAPFYYDGPAWKHLSEAQPAFYSAVDADATMRVYLGVRAELQRQGRWERWLRHCVEATPILRRMGQRGVLINRERQGELKVRLERERDEKMAQLQREVPPELKPFKVYKRPREGAVERKVRCTKCASEEAVQNGHKAEVHGVDVQTD